MSDQEFVPPPCAFDLKEFSESTLEQIAAKTVTCATCPVSMLCQAEEGGTGYVCRECGMTGVWIDEPDSQRPSKDVYRIDCNRHKFGTRGDGGRMTRCDHCTGEVMELYLRHPTNRQHYIFTEHAKYSAEVRRDHYADSLAYWKNRLEEEQKEKTKARLVAAGGR